MALLKFGKCKEAQSTGQFHESVLVFKPIEYITVQVGHMPEELGDRVMSALTQEAEAQEGRVCSALCA